MMLIQRGFDINTVNEAGDGALHVAIREESSDVVAGLLRIPKLNFDLRNRADETPLMLAALKGRQDWVDALLKLNADVNKPGWAALHYAATGGHAQLVQRLLDLHAYIDAESPNKSTPLMMAAMYGNVATVRVLLDEGADWRLKNEQGFTALDFAEQGQRPDTVKLLGDLAKGLATARAREPIAAASGPSSAAEDKAKSVGKPLPKGGW